MEDLAVLPGFQVPSAPTAVEVLDERGPPGYVERLIRYRTWGGKQIRAFLLLPEAAGPHPAVVAHHQHNSEWHLEKSEVAGVAGDPHQAFGPALARRGVGLLAPDTICFEDRRRNGTGSGPREGDWLQHYNEMAYRLVAGRTLWAPSSATPRRPFRFCRRWRPSTSGVSA